MWYAWDVVVRPGLMCHLTMVTLFVVEEENFCSCPHNVIHTGKELSELMEE